MLRGSTDPPPHDEQLIAPVRNLAEHTIDMSAVLRSIFLPGSVSDRIVCAYAKHLFRCATLQDLPSDAEGLKREASAVRCDMQDEGPGLSTENRKKLFGTFAGLIAKPTGERVSTDSRPV